MKKNGATRNVKQQNSLSHIDKQGKAKMVDVSQKDPC